MRILIVVQDCQHEMCKQFRLYDKVDLYTAPARYMPDDSIVVDREDAQQILRLVMN